MINIETSQLLVGYTREIKCSMSIWGPGTFENDGAGDLLVMMLHKQSLQPVIEAFDSIIGLNRYIDVDYGEQAIAGAEVIALLRGRPTDSLPEGLVQWYEMKNTYAADDALRDKAILSVEKAYLDPKVSEIRGLFEEAGGEFLSNWKENVLDLLYRLRA